MARKRKCIYPSCKKTTFTNDGLCCSRKRSNGRQAGSPTCFYNRCVCVGCYGMTNVRALSCFHLLWMQKSQQQRKSLQQSLWFVLSFSLRIMNLLQNHTSKEVKLKDKTMGKTVGKTPWKPCFFFKTWHWVFKLLIGLWTFCWTIIYRKVHKSEGAASGI